MADSQTTNLALTKPQVGVSTTWATKTNENWDTLDALFPGGVLGVENGGTGVGAAPWVIEGLTVENPTGVTRAKFQAGSGQNDQLVKFFNNSGSLISAIEADATISTYDSSESRQIVLGETQGMGSGVRLYWKSATSYDSGSSDIGISRNAAGILEINNGTPGAFRDIRYRRSRHTVVAVSYSATPVFDASAGSSFTITLTGNVTSSTLNNIVAGQTVTFKIVQDGTGGRSFVWPTNVLGGMTIDDAAAAINCQQFHCFDGTNLEAISLGSQR